VLQRAAACAVVIWLQRKDGNNAASDNVSGSCSVLQCVAVCCSVFLRCGCSAKMATTLRRATCQVVEVCCSVLQRVAAWAIVMWLQRKDGNNAVSGNVSGS